MYNQNNRSEWGYLRQMAQDLKYLREAVADLRENRVKPEQVYTREVVDGMINDIRDEVSGIKEALREERQNLYKILGLAGTAITIIYYVAQHITIH
jgi:hypothetical protein